MRTSLVALSVMLAVACGGGSTAGGPTVGRVTLEVSGGIAGWDRVLTVESDGSVHVRSPRGPTPSPTVEKLDPDVLNRLHELVSDPAFAQLAPAYVPPQPGADLLDYTVSAEVDGKTLKTMARQGSSPPPILREVLDILRGLFGAA